MPKSEEPTGKAEEEQPTAKAEKQPRAKPRRQPTAREGGRTRTPESEPADPQPSRGDLERLRARLRRKFH